VRNGNTLLLQAAAGVLKAAPNARISLRQSAVGYDHEGANKRHVSKPRNRSHIVSSEFLDLS